MQQPHRSLWLRQALDGEPAAPLEGDERCDVAVLGGGFVGLWTALHLKRLSPGTDVAILERDICGGGASGRNGGMALSWWAKLPSLVAMLGVETALTVAAQSEHAIEEVLRFCAGLPDGAGARRDGWLWTATTPAQRGAWESCVALCEELGVGPFQRLEPAAVARRAGSPVHIEGVFDRSAATLQPAALARGLRAAALAAGVRIFEGTEVLPGAASGPLRSARGTMAAERRVVALGAWAAGLAQLRRSLVVLSSDVVATVPVLDRLREIGWSDGVGVTNSLSLVDYYRTTPEGRVVFGKGGGRVALGGRIGPQFDRDDRLVARATADLRRIYPALADVPVEASWSGPVDRSPNGLPMFGRLGDGSRTAYAVGWSGNGVAPSWIGGRVMASLALDRRDEWAEHPLVGRRLGRFPPDPIRYLGGSLVREAVRRKEAAEERGERPRWLARKLADLVPAGLEDS